MSGPNPGDREEDELIGSLLDNRYRIERKLGEGGMGLVYEAVHQVLKVRVAIKVLRTDAADDEEALERLRREAQSASQIGSEHIVDVRDFGQLPDGSTYVVMELIDGIDLFRELHTVTIGWKRALGIAVQICEALAAAHDRGIVHRDLKAENVLLTRKGTENDFVKIVDFGIAKIAGSAKITMAGRVMGTPEYMSPEQCAGIGVDHRTDIYSLGILMYEMVTGKLPFASGDLVELIKLQMQQAPVAPSKVVPGGDIPLGFEAIILRCLAKKPEDRPQSMHEVAKALVEVDPAAERWLKSAKKRPVAMPTEATIDGDEDSVERVEKETPLPPVAQVVDRPAPGGLGRWGVVLGMIGVTAGVSAVLLMLEPEPSTSPIASAEVRPVVPESVGPIDSDAPPAATGEGVSPEPEPPPPEPAVIHEVRIETDPEGVAVYDGDAMLGSTPLSLRRVPDRDRWHLVLRRAGYLEHEITIGSLTGDEVRIVMRRAPASVSPPPETPAMVDRPPRDRPGGRDQNGRFLDPWSAE